MAFEDYMTQYTNEKVISDVSGYVKGNMTNTEIVNGLFMTYDIWDIKEYRIVLTSCTERNIAFGTCNCTGFFYQKRCKHIHYAILKKLETVHHIQSPKQSQKQGNNT